MHNPAQSCTNLHNPSLILSISFFRKKKKNGSLFGLLHTKYMDKKDKYVARNDTQCLLYILYLNNGGEWMARRKEKYYVKDG